MANYSTLAGLFEYTVRKHEKSDLFYKRVSDTWKPVSAEAAWVSVKHLSLGLYKLGIKRGEGVALLSQSSPEWLIVDLAIMIAGGITVPIFRKISPESLEFELRDSSARYLFLGDYEELDFVSRHGAGLSGIVQFNRDDPRMDTGFLDALMESGARAESEDPGLFQRLLATPREADIASIVYTSGSAGLPKGVEITHGNIVSQVTAAAEILPIEHELDVALSTLPLAHIFERMVVYYYLSKGVPVYFVDNIGNLANLMTDVRPTILTVVPRILEKVHSRIGMRVAERKGVEGAIARLAFAHAEKKKSINPLSMIAGAVYRKLVYSKFVEAFGGRLRYLVCGASALPPVIGRFVENIGVPLYEGYGLTEASPVVAANCPKAHKIGTVGRIFPGVTARTADDGEILVSGPNVMRGYHNDPEATAQAIDKDGWLHTGDRGRIDSRGFLTIQGRKKELFKKSTGEYVPPIPIEQALARHEIVDAAMVIADGREITTCLLFPDFDKLAEYKKLHGFEQYPDKDFFSSEWLENNIRDFIEDVNTHLHQCEKIRRFAIVDKPISVETGELTPTLKIRRWIIEKKYKSVIDKMYNGG